VFLHPLGLLALLGVPAVVFLHLFRRRFRQEVVSALFLWSEVSEVSLGGRKRERLVRSPSFWCEVAAALLFALAFAGPRGCSPSSARHLVVVLDGSAAMGAVATDGPLARRATELVARRIDELGSDGRVTLIESGPRPRLIAGPGALPAEARRALADFRPEAARHELSAAIALAEKIAGDGAVLVVSPRFEPERHPPEVELASVGTPLENTAVVRARRSSPARATIGATPGATTGDGERVELVLAHHGSLPATTGVELVAEDQVLASRTITLAPGERRELAFDLSKVAADVLERVSLRARLTSGGALAIDDTAYLAPPPPRTLAVGTTLTLDELRALGVAKSGGSAIGRWLALVPDSVEVPAELAHVLLGAPPATGAGAESLGVAFVPSAGATDERRDWIGPFLIEKRHPLLSGVTLDGVIWSAAPAAGLAGSPLISAGNEPLLVEEREHGRRVFRANLDPARSTLVRSPDWPILLANLAEMARDELPGPDRTSLATGEPFVYRARREATYRLLGPDIDRTVRAREVLVLDTDVERPGEYELREGTRTLCRFGVSFSDPAESDLTGLASGERPSSAGLAGLEAGSTPLERALLLLALALVVADWWWLARRTAPTADVAFASPGRGPAG
jgi:hypothetical protein